MMDINPIVERKFDEIPNNFIRYLRYPNNDFTALPAENTIYSGVDTKSGDVVYMTIPMVWCYIQYRLGGKNSLAIRTKYGGNSWSAWRSI